MSALLKVFSLETIAQFLAAALRDALKNPYSTKAKRLRLFVRILHEVCEVFLAKVPE